MPIIKHLLYHDSNQSKVIAKYFEGKMKSMKKALVAVIILAFVIASATVYGLLNLNSAIQAKPEQSAFNYSSDVGSLNPQISSLNNSVSSLGTLKNDITAMKNKLSDIETKITQAQQEASISSKPVTVLDRSSYSSGGTAYVIAAGLDPQKVVQIQLIDSRGYVLTQAQTSPDSSGKLAYDIPLPSTLSSGSYQIKLISDQMTASQPIFITNTIQNSGSVTLRGIYVFSAQTDQSVYSSTDLIEVLGTGQPNTSVSAVLTSPSGKTFTENTTIQTDGTFSMFFNSQPFEQGNWFVKVSNQGVTKLLYLSVQSSNSAIFYPLTARADKTIYTQGDQIHVLGTGAPLTAVNAVFTSPSGKTYSTSTTAGSDGSYELSFTTTLSFETGYWYFTITNDGQTKGSYSVYLASGNSINANMFTAQTDKTFYIQGDQIQVSGLGTPFTTVSAVLTSPSGRTFTDSTATASDGSYQIAYSTSQSFETGYWYLNVTNEGESKSFSIYVGSYNPSTSSFTAQTDKTIYLKGEQINILGAGKPYTTVKAILKSPSGITYDDSVASNADGSYVVSFPTSSAYETGNWDIAITNWSITKVLSIFLEPRT